MSHDQKRASDWTRQDPVAEQLAVRDFTRPSFSKRLKGVACETRLFDQCCIARRKRGGLGLAACNIGKVGVAWGRGLDVPDPEAITLHVTVNYSHK